jgi:hypothetical protein
MARLSISTIKLRTIKKVLLCGVTTTASEDIGDESSRSEGH